MSRRDMVRLCVELRKHFFVSGTTFNTLSSECIKSGTLMFSKYVGIACTTCKAED